MDLNRSSRGCGGSWPQALPAFPGQGQAGMTPANSSGRGLPSAALSVQQSSTTGRDVRAIAAQFVSGLFGSASGASSSSVSLRRVACADNPLEGQQRQMAMEQIQVHGGGGGGYAAIEYEEHQTPADIAAEAAETLRGMYEGPQDRLYGRGPDLGLYGPGPQPGDAGRLNPFIQARINEAVQATPLRLAAEEDYGLIGSAPPYVGASMHGLLKNKNKIKK